MSMQGIRALTDLRKLRRPLERPKPQRVVRPLEEFLRRETGSASLLMLATAAALAWVNIAEGSYARVWEATVSVRFGPVQIEEDVRHVVNDLLMAVFFYVVALEVKRELLFGSLRDRRSAAVPAAAAFGTMVGAALTYLAVNAIRDGDLRGWAIPIATDIAFAVGVLGLAGRRAPRELRAFMLTLAVVDDIATIAVIAIFFASGIALAWLGVAAGVVLAIVLAQRIGLRLLIPYGLLAGLLWIAVFKSGVHATIAGVVLGFLTPATALRPRRHAKQMLSEVRGGDGSNGEATDGALLHASRVSEEARSPLARMEARLHPWTAFVILPLFALANAGVVVSIGGVLDALTAPIGQGIFLGLVVGAPLVGFGFAWVLVRIRIARLPDGLDWPAIGGVAPLKGIGFTVAIFIAALAFDDQAHQDEAKLAILVGSAVAALIGLTVLYVRAAVVRRKPPPRHPSFSRRRPSENA
jgi:Na+:H+ antiporter, NhaA family